MPYNNITLRVCFSGLGLIVPIGGDRVKVLMPVSGPGKPAATLHRAVMRFDHGHTTSPAAPSPTVDSCVLDGETVIIPDGASSQSCPWASDGIIDLSATYAKPVPKALLNEPPGADLACVLTIPPAEARCVAIGNRWKLKGNQVRLSWLMRWDIRFDTPSVTICGHTLYPFGNGLIDVSIVNEPTVSVGKPNQDDPAPHMEGLYRLIGINNDPVPTFIEKVGDDTCDGWLPGSRTDAFQCMPAVATPA